MDDLDRASETEEQHRAQALRARRPVSAALAKKRNLLAEAQAITKKHGADAAAHLLGDLTCENCGDPLQLDSASVFCCSECTADWTKRDSASRRAGL